MAAAPNIGDLLLEWGAITRGQLSDALSHQREHGGRLGSALVDLGFVDEKTLAAALARQLSIPAVSKDQIDRAPAVVAQLLPGPLAARLRVAPVREDAGRLWVAMSDPTDKSAVDEIARLTRRPVRTMVAPERLIEYALERFYRITPPKRAPSPAPEVDLEQEVDVTADTVGDITGYLDEASSFDPLAKPSPRGGLAEVATQLSTAVSDDAVLDVVLQYLAREVPRQCAFAVRHGELAVWRTWNVDTVPLKHVRAAVADLPLIKRGLDTGESFAGRIESFSLGGLAAPLGLVGDTLGVMVPVRVGKLPVGCIIGVDASLEALRRKPELDRLAVKIDQALHINYLRRMLLQG